MSEAKPTPGPCYADGQVVHSDAVSYIAIFGEAVPRRGWSGSDYATNAHKDANAELFADALNVLTDNGLTPSQLVERVKELEETLDHMAKSMTRQLALIADRAPGPYLDKRPVVQTLHMHAQRAQKALSKARPNTAEGETEAEATDGTRWNQTPCEHCGHTEGEHFNARCLHITGETRYTPATAKEPSP